MRGIFLGSCRRGNKSFLTHSLPLSQCHLQGLFFCGHLTRTQAELFRFQKAQLYVNLSTASTTTFSVNDENGRQPGTECTYIGSGAKIL